MSARPVLRPSFKRLVAKSGGVLLQRVVLQYSFSDAVQEQRAEPGDFLLGARNLGKAFVAHVGPWRPHAVRFVNREVEAESFDESSLVFQEIQEEAKRRGRTEGRTARVGVEFLLWLPQARAFALFEFTKFATRNADTARARSGGLALFTTEPVGTGGWFIPVCADAPPGRYRALPVRRNAAAVAVFTDHRPEVPGPTRPGAA